VPNTTVDRAGTQERRCSFGPHVIRLASFLRDSKVPPDDVVGFLHEVDRRWPGLSFRDFLGACVLAEALAMQPRGRA
jgi:hypothetical protein